MALKTAAVVARFPERELEIHRQYAHDEKFQEVCEDYRDCLVALQHWEGAGGAGAGRVEDYRRIRDELEEEILQTLDGPQRRRPDREQG